MRTVLFVALLGLLLGPLRAEDWTTTDGKVYQNVQVLSHNAAYVTILHESGGGRIPLSTLSPALQKRFDYDPAKAAPILAATAAADQQSAEALAKEKKRVQAEEAQRQKEVAAALEAALFSGNPNAPSPDDTAVNDRPIASEPPTEIDDEGYGDFGGDDGYGDYGGYGYSYGHYGGHHDGGRIHHGTRSFSPGGSFRH